MLRTLPTQKSVYGYAGVYGGENMSWWHEYTDCLPRPNQPNFNEGGKGGQRVHNVKRSSNL